MKIRISQYELEKKTNANSDSTIRTREKLKAQIHVKNPNSRFQQALE